MFFLLIPLLQQFLNLFPVKPLKGAIINLPDTSFTWKGWLNGSFQKKKEKYVNENFGLRNIFLRINNEIKFDLFGKIYAHDVIVGKENYLFEKNYIKAYNGEDFIGVDSIKKISDQLKFIQDELKKSNIA